MVDIQPVGDGAPALKYLAPYVHRVAISDRRIVGYDEQSVTYRVTPSKSRICQTRTVAGYKFLQSFLQHTLPKGFQKVRHYGWMSAKSKIKVDELKWLIWLSLGWTYWLASAHADQSVPPRQATCADCGRPLRLVAIVTPTIAIYPRSLRDQALAYQDSG